MRHVLVTGAAGGLGSSLCDQLAAAGDAVFAADLDVGSRSMPPARPGVVALRMDVTSSRDVARARRRIEAAADGLDGVVCCAGIYRAGALVEADEGEMARSLDVNLLGAFRVVRGFFPLLAKRRGTVVLVGTELSRCPMPFTGPYTVSKCALQAFADALRRELMFLGMRVVVIQPGAIRTPLLRDARAMAEAGTARTLFPAQREVIRRMLEREWDRGGEPADVARVAVRALHAKRPRAVYRVGNNPLRAMLAALPVPWIDALLRAFVRLRAPAPARRSASGGTRAPRCAARARGASPRG